MFCPFLLLQNSLPQQQSAQLPPKVACGAIPRTPARLPEDVTALAERENNSKNNDMRDSSKNAVTKTYHTLKDLISSKFRKDNSEGKSFSPEKNNFEK